MNNILISGCTFLHLKGKPTVKTGSFQCVVYGHVSDIQEFYFTFHFYYKVKSFIIHLTYDLECTENTKSVILNYYSERNNYSYI